MTTKEQQAKVVEDILAAPTLYDVLGVQQANSLDASALRKAYLTTSVKVHPDKNQHPQATEAFQRVAEAWGILSDESAKQMYDAELRGSSYAGGGGGGGGSPAAANGSSKNAGTQYYAYDFERSNMPSFADALFMFAAVTSMFSASVKGSGGAAAAGGGGRGGATASASRSGSAVHAASDLMETLFWAQKLAEGRNHDNMSNQDFQNRSADGSFQPQNNADTIKNHPLTSGMAFGSGLRAVAGAQRMMGMRKSAAATEKAATAVQVAAMGATVLKAASENPAVQRTLERGQSNFKNNPQLGKSIQASFKMAGTVIQALQRAQEESRQQQQQQRTNDGTRR